MAFEFVDDYVQFLYEMMLDDRQMSIDDELNRKKNIWKQPKIEKIYLKLLAEIREHEVEQTDWNKNIYKRK